MQQPYIDSLGAEYQIWLSARLIILQCFALLGLCVPLQSETRLRTES